MKVFEVVNLDEGPTNKIDMYISLRYPELSIERLIKQADDAKQKYEKDTSVGKGWITNALTEVDNLCSAAMNHSSFWKEDTPEVEEAYNRYVELFNQNQDYLDNLA